MGSSFEAISSITGGQYSVIKQTSGDRDNRTKNSKAETIGQGLANGVMGFGEELVNGVTGIV